MARVPERLSAGGGGAATSAGILFQQQLGALVGTWLLGERPFDQRLALGHAKPLWVRFETEAPVDDILVATSAGGFVAIQAKTTASLSRDLLSPFGKTISQFARHWLACRGGDGSLHWNRPLDPLTDRLVLAVGRQAPATVREDLPAALRLRAQPGGGILTDAQTRAFDDFESCVAQAWATATTDPFEPAIAETLARLVTVLTFDPAGPDRMASLAALRSLVADPKLRESMAHIIVSYRNVLLSRQKKTMKAHEAATEDVKVALQTLKALETAGELGTVYGESTAEFNELIQIKAPDLMPLDDESVLEQFIEISRNVGS